MRVLDRVEQVGKELEAARAGGARIGLVPTMGALHEGHASLIERSARENDVTLVTLFVNPLQFGPSEDFERYPRVLAADRVVAERAGADLVLAPAAGEMFPEAPVTRVEVRGGLTERFEGATRPGHFAGVATVVAKLFAITGPCRAYFGEKDFQQLAVVRRLAADLSFPVEVVACPTVRDDEGLALSSRNAYLSPAGRVAATVLIRALRAAASQVSAGDPGRLRQEMAAVVAAEPLATLDYADVVDPDTLEPLEGVEPVEGGARLLIAARIEGVHLIDNMPLEGGQH